MSDTYDRNTMYCYECDLFFNWDTDTADCFNIEMYGLCLDCDSDDDDDTDDTDDGHGIPPTPYEDLNPTSDPDTGTIVTTGAPVIAVHDRDTDQLAANDTQPITKTDTGLRFFYDDSVKFIDGTAQD